MKFLGVTILRGVEFPIFLLIFAWALQQCGATVLPVIELKLHSLANISAAESIHVSSTTFTQSAQKATEFGEIKQPLDLL